MIPVPVKPLHLKDVAVDRSLLAGVCVRKLLDRRTAGTKNMIFSGFERKFSEVENFLPKS